MSDTPPTTPMRPIEADIHSFAHARTENADSAQPTLFLVRHFRSGLNQPDPILTDHMTSVIASSGATPRHHVKELAEDIRLITPALNLALLNMLGFSIGSFQVQEVALRHPQLVRKLLLLNTSPSGCNMKSRPSPAHPKRAGCNLPRKRGTAASFDTLRTLSKRHELYWLP